MNSSLSMREIAISNNKPVADDASQLRPIRRRQVADGVELLPFALRWIGNVAANGVDCRTVVCRVLKRIAIRSSVANLYREVWKYYPGYLRALCLSMKQEYFYSDSRGIAVNVSQIFLQPTVYLSTCRLPEQSFTSSHMTAATNNSA